MKICTCGGGNFPAPSATGPGASLTMPEPPTDPKICPTCGDLVANCTGAEEEEDTMPIDNIPRLRTWLARRHSRISVGLLVTLGLIDLVFTVYFLLQGRWVLALLG